MPKTDQQLIDSFDQFVNDAKDTYIAIRKAMVNDRWDAASELMTNLTNQQARVSLTIKNAVTKAV